MKGDISANNIMRSVIALTTLWILSIVCLFIFGLREAVGPVVLLGMGAIVFISCILALVWAIFFAPTRRDKIHG